MKINIGLALGGGGARGLAHLGVLKVFREANISIDSIAGTSIGSIIGGAFSIYPDISLLDKKIFPLLKREVLSRMESLSVSVTRPHQEEVALHMRIASFIKEIYISNLRVAKKSLVEGKGIYNIIKELVGDTDFSQTKIPFTAIAVNLKTGEEVIINNGPMAKAILASCAMPGVFPPVKLGKQLLVDGGIISVVPVQAARSMGADIVIAVNLEKGDLRKTFRHGLDISFQADDIRARELNRLKLAAADIIVEPEVGDIGWTHFSQAQECIKEGEKAARAALPEIKKLISLTRKKLFIQKLLYPFRKPKKILTTEYTEKNKNIN